MVLLGDNHFLGANLQVKLERIQVEFKVKFVTEDPSLVVKVNPCGKSYGTSSRYWEVVLLKWYHNFYISFGSTVQDSECLYATKHVFLFSPA